MTRHPLVSIVAPVYNGASHVAATLRSLAGQTCKALELIVVDDGSTDDTLAHKRSRRLRRTRDAAANSGVSGARNAGLAAARGDFIGIVNQDDHWYPMHSARQLAAFVADTGCGVVVSPYQHRYPDDSGVPPPQQVLLRQPADQAEAEAEFSGWIHYQFTMDCWALTSATMIRRDLRERISAFDNALPHSDDCDLWLRLSHEMPFTKLTWPPVLYDEQADQCPRNVRTSDWRCELPLRSAEEAHGLASQGGHAPSLANLGRVQSGCKLEFGWLRFSWGSVRTRVRALQTGVHPYPRHGWRATKITLVAMAHRLAPGRARRSADLLRPAGQAETAHAVVTGQDGRYSDPAALDRDPKLAP